MFIQKSRGSSAFDKQKVKNIAIEYRLQSIFSYPEVFCSCFGAGYLKRLINDANLAYFYLLE